MREGSGSLSGGREISGLPLMTSAAGTLETEREAETGGGNAAAPIEGERVLHHDPQQRGICVAR